MAIRWRHLILALAGALLVTTGCATQRVSGIPGEPDMNLVWPVPPDLPRIAYLHQIHIPADVGVRERGLKRLLAAVAGRAPDPTIESPIGLYADPSGWLFVADTGLQVVHLFHLGEQRYAQAFRYPGGRLASPVGVAFDPERGWVFVSDSILNQIFIYDTRGHFIGVMGDGLLRVAGLAWDAERQRLIAADTGNHRVLVFDRDGNLIQTVGERGTEAGQFNFPTHVAVDGEGRIFVSDSLNFRVQVLDVDGVPMQNIGRLGGTVGSFAKPKGVAVDSEGRLFVVDGIYDVVQLFDAEGRLLMHFGGAGSSPGRFWLPAGIAVAGDKIFVADTHNRRVQLFKLLPGPQGDGG